MKKLVLPVLFIGLIQATGCTPVDTFEGDLDVAWEFTAGTEDELVGSCDDMGAVIAAVIATDVRDPDFTVVAEFDCLAGSGIFPVPEGDWDVTIDFLDRSDVVVGEAGIATAVPIEFDLITELDTFVLASDGGYFDYDWSLEEVDDVTGEPIREITCTDALADGLRIFAASADGSVEDQEITFPCDLLGITADAKLFFGEYDLTITLIQGETVLSQPFLIDQVLVEVANSVQDLGQTIFEFLDSDIPDA
jgi:hypothetical protein